MQNNMLCGIFSVGKSGSTLLTSLVDKAKGYYVHPIEIIYLSAVNDLKNFKFIKDNTAKLGKKNPVKNLNEIIDYKYLVNSPHFLHIIKKIKEDILIPNNINLDNYDFEKFNGLKGKYKDFINIFFKSLNNWIFNDEKNKFIFNSNEVNYLDEYIKFFPEIKIIHLIRNPFDTYSSLVRSTRTIDSGIKFHSFYQGEDNMENILRRWNNHYNFIKKVSKEKEKNHLIIKYEDLVTDTKKQLKIIFNFLETALPENIDEITLLKNKKYSLNFNTIGYSKKNKSVENLDKVVKSTSEYFSYQKDLIYDNEFKLINLLCKEGLIYYNYNNKFNTTNKLNLFFDWLAPMKWEFKHLISGIFLRRKRKYFVFLYPEVYQNLIKSVYYFFYRRIKLIFFGIN